eukprot:6469794-Prymnesium_polylepis.1
MDNIRAAQAAMAETDADFARCIADGCAPLPTPSPANRVPSPYRVHPVSLFYTMCHEGCTVERPTCTARTAPYSHPCQLLCTNTTCHLVCNKVLRARSRSSTRRLPRACRRC